MRPGSSLSIVAWATFIFFVGVSIGISYPVSYIEMEIASGKMPPIPRLVLDFLYQRHYWHVLPVLALLILFLLKKREVLTKAFCRWIWSCLAVLWITAWILSPLIFFYMNLFFMMRFGFELKFRLTFAIYVAIVLAVIAWKRISSNRPGQPA